MCGRRPAGSRCLARRTALLFALALCARATGATPPLCVVHERAVPGLEPEALREALSIESRAASFAWAEAPSRERCPPARKGEGLVWLSVGEAGQAVLHLADGSSCPMDLDAVEPAERAESLSRRLVSLLSSPSARRQEPVLEAELRPFWPPIADSPSSSPAGAAGFLSLAGAFAFDAAEELGVGELSVGGGMAWFEERLLVGLVAAWQPERSAASASVQAALVGLGARGGLRLSPVWLRGAVVAGALFRFLRHEPASRLEPVDAASAVPFLDLEIEASIAVSGALRATLFAGTRAHLFWTDYAFSEAHVYASPRFSPRVGARLEVSLGGRP